MPSYYYLCTNTGILSLAVVGVNKLVSLGNTITNEQSWKHKY